MKVIALTEFGDVGNFTEQDWPLPEPQAGEVRVRVHAVAINPVDYKFRQGRFGGELPIVLGFDAAGVIDAVGEGVTSLAAGDEVYAYLAGQHSNGAAAEFFCSPASFVARKPKNLDMLQAAAFPLGGLTAYQAVMAPGMLGAGHAVFVAGGSGGVGSIAIQMLRHLGADPILTTAGSDASVTYLTEELRIPDEHILRYRGLDLRELYDHVIAMNGGKRVAAAFDFWGGTMKRLCCNVADFDGHIVSIVEEPPGFELNVWNARRSPLFARSASLHFEYLGARAVFGGPEDWKVYQTQFAELTRMIEAGHVAPIRCRVMEKLSAKTLREAHHRLEAGQIKGKIVIPVV